MKNRHALLATAFIILAFASMPATAGENKIDACGAVIDNPGNYRLANDISDCPGFAILIIASDVSLNLAGHEITCDAFDGVFDAGVEVFGASNVHVRNGTVSGCDIGVDLWLTDHSVVNNITATGNLLDPVWGGIGISGYEASHNLIVGNHAYGNTAGIEFFFGENNRIIGNVSTDNFRAEDAPYPSYGIGIAISFGSNSQVIGNETSRNTDAGIAIANGATGNVIRDNLALDNENYGIGMFSREDFGTPLAYGNLIQGNVALGSGRTDMLEARFDPFASPRELVQPDCANTWKDNTFETVIAPAMCVE